MNEFYKYFLMLVVLFTNNILIGQENYFLEFPTGSRINLESVEGIKSTLGIHAQNSLSLEFLSIDDLNIEHRKYQQYVGGIKIEGAVIALHNYPNGNQLANGLWLKNMATEIIQTARSEEEILKIARNNFSPQRKMSWELNSIDSKYDPTISKVWYDKNYSKKESNYRLAYKVEIFVLLPFESFTLFIDVESGKILHKYSTLQTINVPATGEGLYSMGPVNFTVDSISDASFEMVKHDSLGNVIFRTQNELDNFNVITSTNNEWLDEVAVDCHWGTEKSLEYYQEMHGRSGLDGNGGLIIVNVHAQDPSGGALANAFYQNGTINIGDGIPGSLIEAPLSTLEIIGHELAHGVTEFTAGLIYNSESGAINESMSDIFGVTIEENTFGTYNWQLGEQFDYVFRDMSDPKSLKMPAFYEGEFWIDFADVHTNSSIGNLWYYYLVEGGSGVTENGDAFNVEAIGFEKAAQIAYRTLSVYLTEASNYSDYNSLSIQAAEDIFGACSPEVSSVSIAWSAVGLGEPILPNDIKAEDLKDLVSGCGLGEENIAVKFQFRSCENVIPAGSEINMFYSIDGGSPVSEVLVLNEDMEPKDSINYIFTQPADLSVVGWYDIQTWVNYELDTYSSNDTITIKIENRLVQNEDLKLVGLVHPSLSVLCGLTTTDPIAQLQFLGCETLVSGSVINVKASLGTTILQENYVLTTDLNYEDFFDVPLYGDLSANDYGVSPIELEVSFPEDPIDDNNTFFSNIKFIEPEDTPFIYPFDDPSEVSSLNIKLGTAVDQDTLLDRFDDPNESQAIMFSGGEFFDFNTGELLFEQVFNEDDIWVKNLDRENRTCLCVDATQWDKAYMSFDLFIHTIEDFWFPPYLASNMRVLVNETPVTKTYGYEGNLQFTKEIVDLTEFAGTSFELCFQTKSIIGRNILDWETGMDLLGDQVMLDNINITDDLSVANNDQEINKYELSIFPNPAHDEITVSLTSKQSQDVEFALVNSLGQKISMDKHSIVIGKNEKKISVEHFAPGVYLLITQFLKDGRSTVSKVILE